MDLDEAIDEVRERLGELSADFFTDAEVLRAINEAYRRFCAEEPWSWLLSEWSTQVDDADDGLLELPSNVNPGRMLLLSVSGGGIARGYTMERLEPSAGFRFRYQRTASTGRPEGYYITRADNDGAAQVYVAQLVPVPDTEYDIEMLYYAQPDALADGSDTFLVPEDWCEAIPARAAGKLFLKELDISQKAAEQFGIYYEVLQQARETDQNIAFDETIALGREMPYSRFRTEYDYVMGRIPPTGLGQ